MEQVVEAENWDRALKRVVDNRGGPGVDGMRVEQLTGYLEKQGEGLKKQLAEGTYRPQPVKTVQIPKADGGSRQLGIPTVVDRLVQQAVMQVLQPRWDPTFSEHSYGFRPGRSALQAVQAAQKYIESGRGWVVDIDLERFFDRVNHDRLLAAVADRVQDKRVLRLIRRYLEAGMMQGGLEKPTEEGVPQGGPLTPPTQWNTARHGVASCASWAIQRRGLARPVARGRYPIDHRRALFVDFHSGHQGANQLAPLVPVHLLQTGAHSLGEVGHTTHNLLEFACLCQRLVRPLYLLSGLRNPGSDPLAPYGEIIQVQSACLIGVAQTPQGLLLRSQKTLCIAPLGPQVCHRPIFCAPSGPLLQDLGRVLQQLLHGFPYVLIQLVGPNLLVCAYGPSIEPISIGPRTTVVGVAVLPFRG